MDSTAKLSAHYRNDPSDGLSSELTAYLDTNFLKNLDHLDVTNPRVLVVYSGGNAVGKSTLSKTIGARFNALVLENDAMKRCILQRQPNTDRDELNQLTWQYSTNLYQRLGTVTNNGLVVRDGVIDWYYDRILPLFLEQGYKLFVIAFDLPREKNIELLRKRGDTATTTTARLIEILDDHQIHIARFRNEYKPNVIITEHNLFDSQVVIEALEKFLANSHSVT